MSQSESLHMADSQFRTWRGVGGLPDEDGDGEESRGLQSFDGVAADVEDAVLAALRHLLHARDRGAVEVLVVLPGLDEFVVLQTQDNLEGRSNTFPYFFL